MYKLVLTLFVLLVVLFAGSAYADDNATPSEATLTMTLKIKSPENGYVLSEQHLYIEATAKSLSEFPSSSAMTITVTPEGMGSTVYVEPYCVYMVADSMQTENGSVADTYGVTCNVDWDSTGYNGKNVIIKVTATDTAGRTATSSVEFSVADDSYPTTIEITTPENGYVLSDQHLYIEATAKSLNEFPEGAMKIIVTPEGVDSTTYVEPYCTFMVADSTTPEGTSIPDVYHITCNVDWDSTGYEGKSVEIKAIATDSSGATATDTITVYVKAEESGIIIADVWTDKEYYTMDGDIKVYAKVLNVDGSALLPEQGTVGFYLKNMETGNTLGRYGMLFDNSSGYWKYDAIQPGGNLGVGLWNIELVAEKDGETVEDNSVYFTIAETGGVLIEIQSPENGDSVRGAVKITASAESLNEFPQGENLPSPITFTITSDSGTVAYIFDADCVYAAGGGGGGSGTTTTTYIITCVTEWNSQYYEGEELVLKAEALDSKGNSATHKIKFNVLGGEEKKLTVHLDTPTKTGYGTHMYRISAKAENANSFPSDPMTFSICDSTTASQPYKCQLLTPNDCIVSTTTSLDLYKLSCNVDWNALPYKGKTVLISADVTDSNGNTASDSMRFTVGSATTDKSTLQIKGYNIDTGDLVPGATSVIIRLSATTPKPKPEPTTSRGSGRGVAVGTFTAALEDMPPSDPGILLPDEKKCEIITESPTRDNSWQKLGLDTSSHKEINRYRIQWFSGKWSEWYVPGQNDKDWKVNRDGSERRVWAYFDDHNHQIVSCDNEEAPEEPEPVPASKQTVVGVINANGMDTIDLQRGTYKIITYAVGYTLHTQNLVVKAGEDYGLYAPLASASKPPRKKIIEEAKLIPVREHKTVRVLPSVEKVKVEVLPGSPFREVSVRSEEIKGEQKYVIESAKAEAVVEADVSIDQAKLYITKGDTKLQIKALPKTAQEKIPGVIKTMELDIEKEVPVYNVESERDTYLLAIIPTKMSVKTKIAADSGEVLEEEKPFWSSLAVGG